MAKLTIRKLTRRGDEALAVEAKDLSTVLPQVLQRSAAAVRTDQAEARFVGPDPELIAALVQNEVNAGAKEIEILVVPRIAGG